MITKRADIGSVFTVNKPLMGFKVLFAGKDLFTVFMCAVKRLLPSVCAQMMNQACPVCEGVITAVLCAHIWFLSSMNTSMSDQISLERKALGAI